MRTHVTGMIAMLAACSLWLVLGVVQPTAAAEPPKTVEMTQDEFLARWPAIPETNKLKLIDQFIGSGQIEFASDLLARTQFTTAAGRTGAQFYTGLIARLRGEHDTAIAIFRSILAQEPGLDRVRLELARSLYAMEYDVSARHNVQLLLGSTEDPDLQKQLQAFVNAIDGRKRWSVGAYVSIAPSTNFNQATDNRSVRLNGLEFELSEESRAKSGVGIRAGVSTAYALHLSDQVDLVFGGGAHLREYRDTYFDDYIVSGEVGPRYRFTRGQVGIYATANQRWFGHKSYGQSFGGRINGSYRFTPTTEVEADIGCAKNHHDIAVHLDGTSCFAGVVIDRHFPQARFLRALAGVSTDDTAVEHLTYKSWYVGLGAYAELPFGLTVYLQGKYSKLLYDGMYPGAMIEREDDRFDALVHLTKRDWYYMGFAPQFQYLYTLNKSTIDFHDYDAHSVNITLTKSF